MFTEVDRQTRHINTGVSGAKHALIPCEMGPCHHGMARPQVADGGTASDMEGSCE